MYQETWTKHIHSSLIHTRKQLGNNSNAHQQESGWTNCYSHIMESYKAGKINGLVFHKQHGYILENWAKIASPSRPCKVYYFYKGKTKQNMKTKQHSMWIYICVHVQVAKRFLVKQATFNTKFIPRLGGGGSMCCGRSKLCDEFTTVHFIILLPCLHVSCLYPSLRKVIKKNKPEVIASFKTWQEETSVQISWGML